MFWQSLALDNHMSKLLDDPDLTIEELLNDEYILQNCHERDPRLVDFLCRSENIDYLLNLVCNPPSTTEPLQAVYELPNVAFEVLTSNLPALTDAIVGFEGQKPTPPPSSSPIASEVTEPMVTDDDPPPTDPSNTRRPYLDRLIGSIVEPTSELNPLSASFLSRLLSHLTTKRGDVLIPYLRRHPAFLDAILTRINMCALVDLLIAMAQKETKSQHIVFEWYEQCELPQRLLVSLDPEKSSEMHDSATRCLVELLWLLRNFVAHSHVQQRQKQNNEQECDSDGSPMPGSYHPPMDGMSSYPSDDSGSGEGPNDEQRQSCLSTATRLLDSMESEQFAANILDRMIEGNHLSRSVIVNCVDLLNAVIGKRKSEMASPIEEAGNFDPFYAKDVAQQLLAGIPLDQAFANATGGRNGGTTTMSVNAEMASYIDKFRLPQALVHLAQACQPRLVNLHALLQQPHVQTFLSNIPTTSGDRLKTPLGVGRLSVVRLLANLASSAPPTSGLQLKMLQTGIGRTLMNLFAAYPLNSLLHQAVVDFFTSLLVHAGMLSEDKKPKKQTGSESPMTGDGDEDENNQSADEQNSSQVKSPPPPNSDLVKAIRMDALIDWCLAMLEKSYPSLLDLPSPPSGDNQLPTKPFVKVSPTLGYTGYLWKLVELIEDARRLADSSVDGAESSNATLKPTPMTTDDSPTSPDNSSSPLVPLLFPDSALTKERLENWDLFVVAKLSDIKRQQTPDTIRSYPGVDFMGLNDQSSFSLAAPPSIDSSSATHSGGTGDDDDNSGAGMSSNPAPLSSVFMKLFSYGSTPVASSSNANRSATLDSEDDPDILLEPEDDDDDFDSFVSSRQLQQRLDDERIQEEDEDDEDEEDLVSPVRIRQQRATTKSSGVGGLQSSTVTVTKSDDAIALEGQSSLVNDGDDDAHSPNPAPPSSPVGTDAASPIVQPTSSPQPIVAKSPPMGGNDGPNGRVVQANNLQTDSA